MNQALPSSKGARAGRAPWRFFVAFGALLGAYFAFSLSSPFAAFLESHLAWNARASAWLMRPFEREVRANGAVVRSPRFAVRIGRGCDALDPSAILASAVLAFPVGLRRKWIGLLAGVAALVALNLARIVSLFAVGIVAPDFFDALHHDIWQAAFIFIALAIWAGWAVWATRRPSAAIHAET